MKVKNLDDLLNLINSYNEDAETRTKTGDCCFCGKAHYYGGHNPAPVVTHKGAKCCDECNITVVLKARLKGFCESEG